MTDKICIHCFVSGRVQGVWFRANTEQQAKRLGLTGWVRNVEDGRVEVLACGGRERVAELYVWLQQGPEKAEVGGVSYEELGWEEYGGFVVR